MRFMLRRSGLLGLLLVPTLLFAISAQGQDKPSAAETVENLKLQLIELSAQEESAKLRGQELDEALKPQNIENSLAGIGSLHPEELRAQRRRQLEIQKAQNTAELSILLAQRSRLESAIATAETQAYQESAKGFSVADNALVLTGLPIQWFIVAGCLAVAVILLSLLAFLRFRVKV